MKYSVNSTKYELLRNWLKSKREDSGLSIRALAVKLDVHHSLVGKIENGRRKIDLLEYVEYCKTLEIDPHEGIDLLFEFKKNSLR